MPINRLSGHEDTFLCFVLRNPHPQVRPGKHGCSKHATIQLQKVFPTASKLKIKVLVLKIKVLFLKTKVLVSKPELLFIVSESIAATFAPFSDVMPQ